MISNGKSIEGKTMKVGDCPNCGMTVLVYEGDQELPSGKDGGKVTYEMWTCQICGSTHTYNERRS